MQVMRDTQGRHMPLRLLMERSIVSKVSQPGKHVWCICKFVYVFVTDSKDASSGELYDCSGNSDRNGHLLIS